MNCTNPYFKVLERASDPFNESDKGIHVPCGKCLACRINRRREWTQRLLHEAQSAQSAYFLTLTYDEEHVPIGPSGLPVVDKADVQTFFQDLRNACRDDDCRIRYFLGSEYGELGRPHYHAIVYNIPRRFIDDPSKDWMPGLPLTKKSGKFQSLINRRLNDIWKRGFVSIGEFCRQRAGYCAKYFVDKQDHPEGTLPNFNLMSRRPGIGHDYAEAISEKVRYYGLHACLADNGKYLPLPRYYDKQIYSDEERAERLESLDLDELARPVMDKFESNSMQVIDQQIKRHHSYRNLHKQL